MRSSISMPPLRVHAPFSLYEARRLLEQCLAIDPDYVRASTALSEAHFLAYVQPCDGDYLSLAVLVEARKVGSMPTVLVRRKRWYRRSVKFKADMVQSSACMTSASVWSHREGPSAQSGVAVQPHRRATIAQPVVVQNRRSATALERSVLASGDNKLPWSWFLAKPCLGQPCKIPLASKITFSGPDFVSAVAPYSKAEEPTRTGGGKRRPYARSVP